MKNKKVSYSDYSKNIIDGIKKSKFKKMVALNKSLVKDYDVTL